MKILVAEDDTVCRTVLIKILRTDPSIEVLEANDGDEAWSMLNNNERPDLCIFDNVMPGINGLDLMERMQQHPDLASIPVFLSSVSKNPEEVMKALEFKAAGFILKPVNERKVFDAIKTIKTK